MNHISPSRGNYNDNPSSECPGMEGVCEKINFLNGIAMTVSPYPSPHHPLIMSFMGSYATKKPTAAPLDHPR